MQIVTDQARRSLYRIVTCQHCAQWGKSALWTMGQLLTSCCAVLLKPDDRVRSTVRELSQLGSSPGQGQVKVRLDEDMCIDGVGLGQAHALLQYSAI